MCIRDRLIEDGYDGIFALALDGEAVFKWRQRGRGAAEQFAEEAGFAGGGVRRDIAYKVDALSSVAVLNGKAGAVQCQTNPAPGPVKILINLHNRQVIDHGGA